MQIYRVIYTDVYLDNDLDIVEVKTFLNKDLAISYIKRKISKLKEGVDGDEKDYHIEETENFYDRYIDGRYFEDHVSIWLEEDTFYDELELQEEQKLKNEKENDYDI